MTASHILLQVTCFNATESDFQNFRTNWTNFRTLSEFQDISGHFKISGPRSGLHRALFL